MTDQATVLVTGLDPHECYERFSELFGKCAHDYCSGQYDDAVRVRANYWWSAYRRMAT